MKETGIRISIQGHAGDGSANELSLVNAMDYAIRMANAKKEKEVEA